jgi:N-acyl-D-aspartate/D-glutamate deacylase
MAHDWSELLVSAVQSEANEGLIGKTLLEGAHERDTSPIDFMFDLILEEKGAVNILEFNQSEENLRVNLRHPLSIIISDGFYVKGRPHPRLHGTFPELLGLFCRERKWLDLPTAIHKVTGFPADRFGLSGKGYLRKGYQADVTVFDPLQVRSRATYQEPTLSPQGIRYVFKQGRMLLPECAPAK